MGRVVWLSQALPTVSLVFHCLYDQCRLSSVCIHAVESADVVMSDGGQHTLLLKHFLFEGSKKKTDMKIVSPFEILFEKHLWICVMPTYWPNMEISAVYTVCGFHTW